MGATLGILRWVLFRLGSSPVAWLAFALASCLWVAILVLSPIGLTSASPGAEPLAYEVAFLSALAGAALAMGVLGEAAWPLELVSPMRRLAARFQTVLFGAALGLAAGAAVPAALARLSHFSWGGLAAGGALAALHLAALGLWVARVPLPGGVRSLVLVALAWLLPDSAGDDMGIGHFLGRLLGVSAHLEPGAVTDALSLSMHTLPIAALLSGAALLELGSRAARRRRDPSPTS